jgi:type I restriction enzyme S subunit
MKRPEIADSQDHISESALHETNIPLIPANSVLIVVRGMILARTFPTAVTRARVTINQDMKALIPVRDLSADFLSSLLTGIQRELLDLVEESGHGTRCMRTDSWETFRVALPPLPEQLTITEQLKSELTQINSTTSRREREIELLREYRTRIIADVVTGKLDVRDAAARLPDGLPLATVEDDVDLGEEVEVADDTAVV